MVTREHATMTNAAHAVRELHTEAQVESLNSALADNDISAEQIITILAVPGQAMVNPKPDQFRVLYRAH